MSGGDTSKIQIHMLYDVLKVPIIGGRYAMYVRNALGNS